MKRNTHFTLYEQVAERIARMIEHGALRPGERVPSVRRLSTQQRVSIATVLEAYRLLEDRGVIEARPQSGYYVRTRVWTPPAEPEISNPPPRATPVNVGELVMRMLRTTGSPSIIQLAVGLPSPDLLPTEHLNRTMASIGRRLGKRGNTYDFPPGNAELRAQITRRLMEAGCTLTPDDIVTTCGCQEAFSLCLRAVARPGDTIAIESPTYYGILQTIEVLGMRALEIPTHPREGINLDALRSTIKQKRVAACLLVPTFNNPLGSCVPDGNKKKLVELLADHDIPLIEDDIYGDLSFAPTRPKAAKAFDRKGLVLLCSSFSKTLAPGYRVGWVTPGRFTAEVKRLKFVSTVATATLPQLAIADFLANGGYDRYLRRIRKVYAEQVQIMTQAVSKFFPEGTRATRPAGGFLLWVELPHGVKVLDLYEQALAEKISIAPGPLFSATQKYQNFIRLNCGYPWSDAVEKALLTLGRLVAEMAHRRRKR